MKTNNSQSSVNGERITTYTSDSVEEKMCQMSLEELKNIITVLF